MVVVRPISEVGEKVGYLPGELENKIDPFYAPIETALRRIIGTDYDDYNYGIKDFVEFRPITYIRGDTLDKKYVIVDDAQNLSPRNIKTIVTRMGEGAKFVMTGDPFQIDNPFLDERDCGLTVTTEELMKNKVPEFVHVILGEVERSRLAEIGATYL